LFCAVGGVDCDTQTESVTTCEAGTQTDFDVIYITDLARYFHDIADKLGAGASLYSMQELSEEKKRLEKELEEQKKFIAAVKSAVSHLS